MIDLDEIIARRDALPERDKLERVFECSNDRAKCQHICCDGMRCADWFRDTLSAFYRVASEDVTAMIRETESLREECAEWERVDARLGANYAAIAKNAITLPFKIGDTVYAIQGRFRSSGDVEIPDRYVYYVDDVRVDQIRYEIFESEGEENTVEITLNDWLDVDDAYATGEEAVVAALKEWTGDTP
jgi:hypothetical protein